MRRCSRGCRRRRVVQSAAMAMRAPMTPAITRGVWIEGRPPLRPGELQIMSFLTVSENYFATAGMRMIRGRGVTSEDGPRAPDVVVVNQAFGRRYFPGQDPIGRRVGYGAPGDPHYWRTIVGLVADTREHLAQPPQPTAYAPFRQSLEPWNFASYLVKSSLPIRCSWRGRPQGRHGVGSGSARFARYGRSRPTCVRRSRRSGLQR